jgi:hypothetical protein
MRVFQNRVLRRIFGLKRDEVTAHNEKFRNLYSSPSTIRMFNLTKMTWASVCRTNGGWEMHVFL